MLLFVIVFTSDWASEELRNNSTCVKRLRKLFQLYFNIAFSLWPQLWSESFNSSSAFKIRLEGMTTGCQRGLLFCQSSSGTVQTPQDSFRQFSPISFIKVTWKSSTQSFCKDRSCFAKTCWIVHQKRPCDMMKQVLALMCTTTASSFLHLNSKIRQRTQFLKAVLQCTF